MDETNISTPDANITITDNTVEHIICNIGYRAVCFLSFVVINIILQSFPSHCHFFIIKGIGSYTVICTVVSQRIKHLAVSYSPCHHNVSCGMCLWEHILDFITRPYIPVWNTVFPHNLLPFRCKSLTFSYLLHYCKCKLTFKSFLDKVYHNVISCTYRRRYGCLALFKKCLCVTKPYISSV